jgi:serine phosphatase RsbU (regulator of sigma subunit)
MAGGKPEAFTRAGIGAVEHVAVPGREVFSRYASFLVVPLRTGDAVTGFMGLARRGGHGFGDGDIPGITRLASAAGAGIANVAALERHRAVSGALQRGLLAAEPPQPEHLEVAGRCRPAEGLVGGDWYDLVPLPEGRTGIVVGDVMGHGPAAAAAMAQLRAAAHALAQIGLEPAELLSQVSRTILTLRGLPMATCAYAIIDPGSCSCDLAAAGHLPPVLVRPEGRARPLELPSGQSLGIGPATYGQARVRLPPGAVLALYTDGLVETRSRPYEQGISELQVALASDAGPLASRCDGLIDALAHCPEDDVTLVLARIPAAPG